MTHEELLARISIDPNVCFGRPCIRGHGIWVTLILGFLAAGVTIEAILEEYPAISTLIGALSIRSIEGKL